MVDFETHDDDLHNHCGHYEQAVRMGSGEAGASSHREWYQLCVFKMRAEKHAQAVERVREEGERWEMSGDDERGGMGWQARIDATVEHREKMERWQQAVEQLRLGLEENMQPNLDLEGRAAPTGGVEPALRHGLLPWRRHAAGASGLSRPRTSRMNSQMRRALGAGPVAAR